MVDLKHFLSQETKRLIGEQEHLEQRLFEIQTILNYLTSQYELGDKEQDKPPASQLPSRRRKANAPTVKSLVEDYFRKTEKFSRPELAKYVLEFRPEVSEASVGAQLGESYKNRLVQRIGPGTYKSNIFQKEEVYGPGPEFGKLTSKL